MSMDTVSPLRQRMIEDMNARRLGAGTQRGHIRSCKQFAAFLERSPDTATAELTSIADAGEAMAVIDGAAASTRRRVLPQKPAATEGDRQTNDAYLIVCSISLTDGTGSPA